MNESYPVPIGDTFEYNGRQYIVEEATDQCVGCAIFKSCLKGSAHDFECVGYRRPDNTDTILKLKK